MTIAELVQQAKVHADEHVRANLKLLKNIKGRTDDQIALGMGERVHWVRERLSGSIKISFPDARAFATYFGVPIQVLDTHPNEFLQIIAGLGFSPSG